MNNFGYIPFKYYLNVSWHQNNIFQKHPLKSNKTSLETLHASDAPQMCYSEASFGMLLYPLCHFTNPKELQQKATAAFYSQHFNTQSMACRLVCVFQLPKQSTFFTRVPKERLKIIRGVVSYIYIHDMIRYDMI